jgi:glycine oxidase
VIQVGVVGAGVIGELTARALVTRGCAVTLFDRGDDERASAVAAGLLSPFSGRELPEPGIIALAEEALSRWRELSAEVAFSDAGTLVVAPLGDEALLDELARGLRRRGLAVESVSGAALRALEPGLGHQGRALFLANEGWIDAQAALAQLAQTPGVHRVQANATPSPHAVRVGKVAHTFDWVVDCRGLGARDELPLRGVRGELLFVDAPEVTLARALRIVSARGAVYVVPRPPRGYVIGATLLESEDRGPISVRATLELLGSACAIHPAFADAKILRTGVSLRPALPDNLPLFTIDDGLVRINGAYRHGFVVGPALAARAADAITPQYWRERACVSS